MESLSTTDVIKLLQRQPTPLFSLSDFERILGIENRRTLYKKIQRLEDKKIIQRLIKGKYRVLLRTVDDFTMANFLYQPSYVSLETALSFYGIITGFPYQITSITTQKARSFDAGGKEFKFSRISPALFWGWEKKEDFLIAEKEKALLDYLYFGLKGFRDFDWDEIDTSEVDRQKLLSFAKRFNNKKILALAATLKR